MMKATKEERGEALENMQKPTFQFDVCVTTYQGLNLGLETLEKREWEYMIVDEGHSIKNDATILAQNCRRIKSKSRILLSGTPLQNSMKELWSLLNFILPTTFDNAEEFEEWFKMDREEGEDEGMSVEEKEERTMNIIHKLQKILGPFILRRTKAQVEKELPPKTEIYMEVALTEMQRKMYKDLLVRGMIDNARGNSTSYMNILCQLRKVCNHPYLFQGIEDLEAPLFGDHLIDSAGKMKVLDKLLPKLFSLGNKVIIFSQMKRMIDILEDYMQMREYAYCRIDGSTDYDERQMQMEEFNLPESKPQIFLLTTRAGGLGINLIGASAIIIYDSDFNPFVDLQAMDRAHRIGQKKEVFVFRFISTHTVEQKIIERQVLRLKLDNLVIQQQANTTTGTKGKGGILSKEEIKEMMKFGADKICTDGGQEIRDEDIDRLLERGKGKAEEMDKMVEEKVNLEYNLKKYNLSDFKLDSLTCNVLLEEEKLAKERKQRESKALSVAIQEQGDEDMADTLRGGKNNNLIHGNSHRHSSRFGVRKVKFEDFHFVGGREGERLKYLIMKERIYRADPLNRTKGKEEKERENYGLTVEEKDEINQLNSHCFRHWKRSEFLLFVRGIVDYGREDFTNIAQMVETKTQEEIKEYSLVFFKNMKKLKTYRKIHNEIARSERDRWQEKEMVQILNEACQGNNTSLFDILLENRGKEEFSLQEDKALLYHTYVCGYNNWVQIRYALINDENLIFNWYLKSRTLEEIQYRIELLVKRIKKSKVYIYIYIIYIIYRSQNLLKAQKKMLRWKRQKMRANPPLASKR